MQLHNVTTLAVTDLETFLYVYDGMKLGVKEGDTVKKGSATAATIQQKEPLVKTFDASSSLYNVGYTSMTVPVLEDGEVTGTVSWTTTTHEAELVNMAKELSLLSENLAERADGFSSGTEALSRANQDMNGMIEQLVEQMSVIGQINELIADLSSKSKILGLNATIEAVRAGDYGKSFSVVAKEIEKLATESAKSAKEVADNLDITKTQIQGIFDRSTRLNKHYEQQAEGAVQMAATVQQVSATATALNDLSSSKSKA